MSNKTISWSQALSGMKGDRAKRPEVREERLRTFSALRGAPGAALSAWRGRSGRRYVVGVHGLDREVAADALPAALIAVRRNDAGLGQIVDLYGGETGASDLGEWVRRAAASGATELHTYRCADGAIARTDIIADLTIPVAEAA